MRERRAIPEIQLEIARARLATNLVDDRVGLVSITTAEVAVRSTKSCALAEDGRFRWQLALMRHTLPHFSIRTCW
jgi:hypothetical protein